MQDIPLIHHDEQINSLGTFLLRALHPYSPKSILYAITQITFSYRNIDDIKPMPEYFVVGNLMVFMMRIFRSELFTESLLQRIAVWLVLEVIGIKLLDLLP